MRWPHFCSHPLLERMLLRVQITLRQIFSVIISLISAVLLCGEGVCVYISKLFSQNCILCLRQGGIVIIQFVTMSLLRYLSRFTIFACTLRWSLTVMQLAAFLIKRVFGGCIYWRLGGSDQCRSGRRDVDDTCCVFLGVSFVSSLAVGSLDAVYSVLDVVDWVVTCSSDRMLCVVYLPQLSDQL